MGGWLSALRAWCWLSACAAAYVRTAGFGQNWVTALIAAYTVYSLGAVFAVRYETPLRAATAIVADATNFAIWTWQAPGDWQPALACGYLLGSTVLLHDLVRAAITFVAALFIALILPPGRNGNLVWTVVAAGGAAAAVGLYKRYLEERMSTTLRHNVMIRSQAQLAREAERQRIAADFHDGPLQSFISFQMRLEVIRKLLARDIEAGARELHQLQELCQSQVADLRSFVRSMRPADEGMGLAASLSRMAELFQRDTGIATTFSGERRARSGRYRGFARGAADRPRGAEQHPEALRRDARGDLGGARRSAVCRSRWKTTARDSLSPARFRWKNWSCCAWVPPASSAA